MAIVGLGGEKLWLCPSLNDNPHDISGNGNNGTYNGGMGTVADVSKGGKRAYSFDGSNGYIRIGNRTNFNFLVQTNYWSMSAWVYHSDLSGQRTVIGGDADNSQHGVNLIESSYNGLGYRGFRAYGSLSAYSPDTRSNTTYTTGVWKHICWVVSGSSSKIYVDGVEEASESASFPTTSNSLTDDVIIGAYSSGTNLYSFMSGKQDDIRIFDRPLTTAEIKHLAKARGITGTPLKKGLGDEKLWLCPSVDDSAEDLSGNGNNGTYNGGMGTVADSSNGGSRAYSFDTSNTQRIDCPSSVMPLNQQSISMSCWVYIASHDSSYGEGLMGVWNYPNANSSYRMLIYVPSNAGGGEFGTAVRVGSTNYQAFSTDSPPPPTQTWLHLVAVLDSNVISLYKDGSLLSSTSFSGSVNGSSLYPFVIGTYNQSNANHYLHGKMDDIRVFHRALTPTEITHLASARGVAGSPYGFKGLGGEKLWLCPSLNDSAEDISGNRHHGTYIAGMGTVADTSNGGTRAYSFNGTTHMLDVDSPPSITGPSASITYWCKSNDFVSWRSPGGYVTNGYDDYRLTFRKTNQSLVVGYARYSTGGIRATDYYSLNNFSYTDWTHYAVVANEGDIYFYVDGVLAATGTGGSGGLDIGSTFTLGSQDLRVGGSWWNGYIDDCRVYDRAITQEEVTHLAKSRGVLGSPHNLNGIVHLLSSFIHPFT